MGYMDLAKSYSNQMRVVEAPASGGGLSQNGKFSYGYASSCGKRSSMEDFFETRIDGIDGEIVGLFGVFDGHGGARAAEYVKRHLFSNLITHPKFISDTKSAITDAYNHTDSELLKSEENSHNRDAGSTASTAILVGDRLVVANVGDSRAVICRGGNAFAVSRDHKPDQSDERERIENAGGFVMWAGTWRVGGVLAVSRAFGDRLLKQYVVADPEIQEEKIDDSLEFLILASDGLWDVFSNEEAVAVVKEVEEPEESTKKLVGEAIKRGSADNITCVVVRFLESKSAINKASQESSTHASSSSQETKHGETEVGKDSDHNFSTIETKQDHTAVQNDLDCNIESEKLKQKPIAATSNLNRNTESENLNQMPNAARSNDSGHISSAQKPTAARSNDSSHISLAQKPIAARSNDSGDITSTQRPVAITEAERRISSEQSDSASQKNQMPVAISSGSKPMNSAKQSGQAHNEMPIAISSGSEAKSSAKQPGHAHNEMPIAIHSGLEAKSSVKVPDQGKITSDNDLDSSIENQKLKIAAKHATPSEQIAIHSDSEAKISAKVPGQTHKLDSSIANQKQKIAATHNTSSEQSGSTGEKNRKPIATHSETATSKASSVHSIAN